MSATRLGTRAAVLSAAVSATTFAPPAAGQAPAPVAIEGVREIEISVRGDEPGAPLDDVLADVVRALHVRRTSPGLARAPAARVAIDLAAPKGVVVSIVDATGALVERRVLPRDVSLEVLREEIGVVLRDGLPVALARPRAPEPAPVAPAPASIEPPAPSRPPEARPGWGADLAASLVGRGLATNTGAIVGGLLAGRFGARGGDVRPVGLLSAELDAPFTATGTWVELRVWSGVVRALPSVDVALSRSVVLEASLGGGVDVLHVEPRVRGEGLTPRVPTTRASAVIAGAAALRLQLGAAELLVSAGADIGLVQRRYVVAGPDGAEAVLAPWRLRPVVSVGLGVPLSGGSGAR